MTTDHVPAFETAMLKTAAYLQKALHPEEGFVVIVFDEGKVDGQAFVSNRVTDAVVKQLRAFIASHEAGELPERTFNLTN